jgi:hypothetical protein
MRKGRAAVIASVGLVLLATPAFAQAYPPTPNALTVSKSSVAAGGAVGVAGTGCGAGEAVTVDLDETQIGTTTADDTGSFNSDVTIPRSATPGSHDLTASCSGGTAFTATITVTAASSGGLPFTGANLAPGLLVGVGLILAGGLLLASIRRRASRQPAAP